MWSNGIRYRLWRDFGYRHIPTIGSLFVLQAVADELVGLLVMLIRRVWSGVLGIGFALRMLVGFLIAVTRGPRGFRESWSAPDSQLAFTLELATRIIPVVAIATTLRHSRVTPNA
jgi:hypothetical protein